MNVSVSYTWNTGKIPRNNNPLLPQNIHGLIVGKSNCGKTTLLLNLLLQPDWLDYNNFFVFGKSLHQQEYQILIYHHRKLSTRTVALEAVSCVKADFYDDCASIPEPADLNVNERNLLILDDCFLGPQKKAEAYYTRGRHNNCDTFYISQNYFRLPRQTIIT